MDRRVSGLAAGTLAFLALLAACAPLRDVLLRFAHDSAFYTLQLARRIGRPRRLPRPGGVVAVGALAALGFVVRVGAWRWLEPTAPVGDMTGYLRQATSLADGNAYVGTFIAPGYPALVAVAMRLGPGGLSAACFLQAFLGSLSIVGVYGAGRRLFSTKVALVAAGILTVEPTHVLYSTMFLSETLAVALVSMAVAGLAGWAGAYGVAFGGVCLGLGALTRESVVALLPLMGFVTWRIRGWRSALSLGATGLLVILPWTMRNLDVTNRPILVSSNTGYNLLVGNNPYADGSQRGGKRIFGLADPPVPESLLAEERHWLGARYALSWARAHPRRFVRKGLSGALRMFGLDRQFLYSLREGYYGVQLGRFEKLLLGALSMGSWLVLLPLALLGMLTAPRLPRALGLSALGWLLLLGFVAFGEWRFRMPVMPLFLLLAVGGVEPLLRGAVSRRQWAALGAALVPVIGLWVHEVLEHAGDVL